MYLKSIEMQGFKSFANKIVLEFHNGITGIVGPNGSGKSNVADAVRWVLGEQSARQLRGESMQDIIFAGTENRRPLGFAYVAITMDNSDHTLPVEYNEVTVSRRVYRSGESEYMINQSPCRLKDIQELFYDTGIGKEGYSIIGQGQIDKILSGKPEDRRELFDEAVGIVKYKKRKEASEKKLVSEHDNLLRVNDILKELEDRVAPLKEQSATAREYLNLREKLKKLDVNMFIRESERIEDDKEKTRKNGEIVEKELQDTKADLEKIKQEYTDLEASLRESEKTIEEYRQAENEIIDRKNEAEKQISVLEEQIKMSSSSDEELSSRINNISLNKEKSTEELDKARSEKESNEESLLSVRKRLKEAVDRKNEAEGKTREISKKIEEANDRLMEILKEEAALKSEEQKYVTMAEQADIRKAGLVKEMLEKKTDEEKLSHDLSEKEAAYKKADEDYLNVVSERKATEEKIASFEKEKNISQETVQKHILDIKTIENSLESLKNMAERYEGFGTSVRTVMEEKDHEDGLIGVVSDLISVEGKYEQAIETALGGNIQNIVTSDEDTAKRMIELLKRKKAGRATFLPLTSVHPDKDHFDREVLSEKGVIGVASGLVKTDSAYKDVIRYLLGRVLVVDTMDHALRFARKYKYREHIVTLEGEYLRPGGSLTGGAFRNKNNLLGRNSRIDSLNKELKEKKEALSEARRRLDELTAAFELSRDSLSDLRKKEQELMVNLNTAKMEYDRSSEALRDHKKNSEDFTKKKSEAEEEAKRLEELKKESEDKLSALQKEHDDLEKDMEFWKKDLSESEPDSKLQEAVSEIRIEESSFVQKSVFIDENIRRLSADIANAEKEIENLKGEAENSRKNNEERSVKAGALKEEIASLDEKRKELTALREKAGQEKESMDEKYKGFFDIRSEKTDRINALDRDLYRIKARYQKLSEELDYQNNYMWDEYELTLHAAMDLKDDELMASPTIKKDISQIRNRIRDMGNVNVNSIEEYKEVSERYEFLKKQHDDLINAEESLKQVIYDLDEGMRKQFRSGFGDIAREFDKTFKELFGGGKGTLELCEDEDILDSGIRIIAQPPGKKLINMMQMSGGEKALTAIALLFAIQRLKPSPFCLLDEIEAALDDSNVDRFANYLKKLSDNTQFIVITHRRGTMNAADRLYGITMQEKGVSVLVSVNLIEKELDN